MKVSTRPGHNCACAGLGCKYNSYCRFVEYKLGKRGVKPGSEFLEVDFNKIVLICQIEAYNENSKKV